MGRSRGGLTTKIHALVDAEGRPVVLKLTPGQAHDGRSAADMLDGVKEGQILLADRAYDSNALRQSMADRGAWACVKPLRTRRNTVAFSSFLYRYRNLVERFFGKLKHFRPVATRFEKHPENYLALVKLAATRIWIRSYESVTYAASGRYIDRMSAYCRSCRYDPHRSEGEGACPFNYLYWDFLARQRARLAGNPRMALPDRNLDRMEPARVAAMRGQAAALRRRLGVEP